MRDLDLTTLRLFVAVCETRSIARAGEQAHIVGSAISKRLAQLESTVGVPLLVRRRRGVELTPAGETLLEHARGMLAGAERIDRDMAAFASGVRGKVRLLVTASVMAESLADDVAAFLQVPAHRDIQVDLEERISAEVVRGVAQGSASLGICWDSPHGTNVGALQSRPYRSDHLALVVHASHPLAGAASVRLEDTLAYDHVSLPVSSAVQVMLHRAAADLGKALVHRVIVSSFDAALRVVNANLAVSIMPREVAAPFAASQGLRLIALNEPWTERRFALCFRSEASLAAPARLLLDHLQKQAST